MSSVNMCSRTHLLHNALLVVYQVGQLFQEEDLAPTTGIARLAYPNCFGFLLAVLLDELRVLCRQYVPIREEIINLAVYHAQLSQRPQQCVLARDDARFREMIQPLRRLRVLVLGRFETAGTPVQVPRSDAVLVPLRPAVCLQYILQAWRHLASIQPATHAHGASLGMRIC